MMSSLCNNHYSTLEQSDIQNIGHVVGVQGCNIAQGIYHI